jgi:hypothetical protein
MTTTTTKPRKNQNNTTTEGAIFRSVSMSLAPPSAPRFLEDSPPQQQKQASNKSLLRNSKSLPVEKSTYQQSTTPNHHHSENNSVDWVWKITKQLSPVPLYHPLERTAATLRDLSLDTITVRISNFLRSQSIATSYQDGRVDCMTSALLKFVVQLWAGGSSNNSHMIILEVQRRQGCCIEMQAIRSQLVQAITTNDDRVTTMSNDPPRSSTCQLVENLLEHNPSIPPKEHPQDCLSTAMTICRQLLQSPRLNENRLGLESLVVLTNPTKVLARDAMQVSNRVLTDFDFQHGLLEQYFVHVNRVGNHEDSDDRDYDDEDNTSMMDYEQGPFFGGLHVLALHVLSNALETTMTTTSPGNTSTFDLSSNTFWQTVLGALYYNLQVASTRPMEAALSIKCLRLLVPDASSTFATTVTTAPPRRLHEYLLHAHHFGKQHHRSLQQETEAWMGRLGFVY